MQYDSGQMRVLGILIVVLGVATIVLMWLMRNVVAPELRRRHIERLEEENARLDELLRKERRK